MSSLQSSLESAIVHAIVDNYGAVLDALLSTGIDPNFTNPDNIEGMEVRPLTVDEHGISLPLGLAVLLEHDQCVVALLKGRENTTTRAFKTAVLDAQQATQQPTPQATQQNLYRPWANTAPTTCCSNLYSRADVCKTVECHIDGEDCDVSPLYYSLRCCNVPITQLLLHHNPVITKNDIHQAFAGSPEMVDLLVRHGKSLDTILYCAIVNHDLRVVNDVINKLFQQGVSLQSRQFIHEPVHTAALYGHVDILEVLVAHNADLVACNCDGETPLHIAAQHGHLDVCKRLIELGADINARDNDSITPLMAAANRRHRLVVELLLDHHAHVSKDFLVTALMMVDLETAHPAVDVVNSMMRISFA